MDVATSVATRSYKVVGKPHRMIQPDGRVMRIDVGDIVTGLTLEDLTAFKDRFAPATPDEVHAFEARQAARAALVDDAPLVLDAAQASAQEAALEAEMVALTQRLDAAKARTAMAQQVQQEAETARQTPRVRTMLTPQAEAERVAREKAEADRVAAERAAASKK